jgi:hypothetical protein
MKAPPVALEPLAVSLVQFRTILYPCSRSTANGLAASGELPTFYNGGRRMVLYADAKAFVARKAAECATRKQGTHEQKSAAGKKGKAVQNAMRRESEAAA